MSAPSAKDADQGSVTSRGTFTSARLLAVLSRPLGGLKDRATWLMSHSFHLGQGSNIPLYVLASSQLYAPLVFSDIAPRFASPSDDGFPVSSELPVFPCATVTKSSLDFFRFPKFFSVPEKGL